MIMVIYQPEISADPRLADERLMDGMGIKEYRAASQRPYTIL